MSAGRAGLLRMQSANLEDPDRTGDEGRSMARCPIFPRRDPAVFVWHDFESSNIAHPFPEHLCVYIGVVQPLTPARLELGVRIREALPVEVPMECFLDLLSAIKFRPRVLNNFTKK